MNEEKRLSLREQLEKITDSPFRAGTDKSLTEAHNRTKEEQLRMDSIKHRPVVDHDNCSGGGLRGGGGQGGVRKSQRRITVGIGAKSAS